MEASDPLTSHVQGLDIRQPILHGPDQGGVELLAGVEIEVGQAAALEMGAALEAVGERGDLIAGQRHQERMHAGLVDQDGIAARRAGDDAQIGLVIAKRRLQIAADACGLSSSR